MAVQRMDDLMALAEACLPIPADEVMLAPSPLADPSKSPTLVRADDVVTDRSDYHDAGHGSSGPPIPFAGVVVSLDRGSHRSCDTLIPSAPQTCDGPGLGSPDTPSSDDGSVALASDSNGQCTTGAHVLDAVLSPRKEATKQPRSRGGHKQDGTRSGFAAPLAASVPGHRVDDPHTATAGRHDDGGGHTSVAAPEVDAVPAPPDDGPVQDGDNSLSSALAGPLAISEEDEVGHPERGTPTLSADLDLLHAVLAHYARMLGDIQKQRVAQGNRVKAMERDGLPEEWTAPALDALDHLAKLERTLNAYLAKQAKRHFLSAWIAKQRGIGLPGFARLLGITGPLDRFATVSKLWRYLGLAVDNGAAPKRQKGVKLNYSPAGRVLCHQIGESIVKMGSGGEYRECYDTKRADYLKRERVGPSGCPTGAVHKTKEGAVIACVKAGEDGREKSAHVHAMARRYATKRLIRRLWVEWRRLSREQLDGE